VFAELPVDLPMVPDADDQHNEHLVTNGVDDAVVPGADTIELLIAERLLDTWRSRIVGERLDPGWRRAWSCTLQSYDSYVRCTSQLGES
jgi:hypothetical protein